ncbi:MAG: hypothetical protein NVSMB19_04880 [Vulcanimicrobiaceae bacterium]
MESNRTEIRTANVRGALVLGALLVAILFLAVAISLRIYTQLDNAARVQRALVLAQQQLDAIVRVQLEEEAALRGYLASGQTLFLDPYGRGAAQFALALGAFEATTKRVGIPPMAASIREMRVLHDTWVATVARPLLAKPHARDAIARQTLGKVLVDRLRGSTRLVHDLLDSRLVDAQVELKGRINEALVGGLSSLLLFAGVSIAFMFSRAKMLAVIDRERAIVETLQRAFRTDVERLPGARVGTAYLSADRDAAVGGDLFDVRRLDATRGLVVVGDISGKGITAAVNTAFVKYSVRTLALAHDDPAAILDAFNRIFLTTIGDPNLFVVLFVGIIDAGQATLTYASAGHGGAYLRRAASVRQLEVTGPIVGLDASMTYRTCVLGLEPGDLLLLATDGLTEARDKTGALLDDEGAMRLLGAAPADPQACADELVGAVRQRNGGAVRDDLAIVAIAIDASKGNA